MTLRGKTRGTRIKLSPSATLATTNTIWTGTGLNLAFCGETPERWHGMFEC